MLEMTIANDGILLLRGNEIRDLLSGREADVVEVVRLAYEAHGAGHSSLPHSTFLRFPHDPSSRIIALPAFVGGTQEAAGVKWIASFPRNLEAGTDRASAAVILNCATTGRVLSFMEGSVISARRTAASAALAAAHLHRGLDSSRAALIGCGPINFEVVRFLRAVFPELRHLTVFDLSPERAGFFRAKCEHEFGSIQIELTGSYEEALAAASLVSFATTAVSPYVSALPAGPRPATVLHVSLRDLAPEVILACDNVVDDVDHVLRAQTSVHLAEQRTGNRSFIGCTLSDVLAGREPARRGESGVVIFSPFGLGVLDMAVAKLAYDLARERGCGSMMEDFLPDMWLSAKGIRVAAGGEIRTCSP